MDDDTCGSERFTHSPRVMESTSARAWGQCFPQRTPSFDSQCGALSFNLAGLDLVWPWRPWRPCQCIGGGWVGNGLLQTRSLPALILPPPRSPKLMPPVIHSGCRIVLLPVPPNHHQTRLVWHPLPGQTAGFFRAGLTPPSSGHLPLGPALSLPFDTHHYTSDKRPDICCRATRNCCTSSVSHR